MRPRLNCATAFRCEADKRGCRFTVAPVEPTLALQGKRDALLAAAANLLNNAFKFTRPHTEVALRAFGAGDRILIEVMDHCGGLRTGDAERMFSPFTQRGDDKTGLGLGLTIARQSVTADDGTLAVQNSPGIGCCFTISLPRHCLPGGQPAQGTIA